MKYKSYFDCNLQYRRQIKEIYEKSFPKDEKFSFWILKQCAKENNIQLDVIIDDIIEKVIGMRFIVNYDNITYLMYLAIDEIYRNKGFGSFVLKDLVTQNNIVLLCIEKPLPGLKDDKIRRKNFYLKNGFYETNCFIEDSGVEYEFLASLKGLEITEEDLKKRYSNMSKNPLIKFIIGRTFDQNINFIN